MPRHKTTHAGVLAVSLPMVLLGGAAPALAENAQATATTSLAVVSSAARSRMTVIPRSLSSRARTATKGTGVALGSGAAAATASGEAALREIALVGDFDTSLFPRRDTWTLDTPDGATKSGGTVDPGPADLTLWGHGAHTNIENTFHRGKRDKRYSGGTWGYSLGADYSPAQGRYLGVAVSYGDTDLTTTYNDGRYRERGWTVSPYAILQPTEDFSILAQAGYGFGRIETTRAAETARGETSSATWYGSVTPTYRFALDGDERAHLDASVPMLGARDVVDGYRETDGTAVAGTTSHTLSLRPALEASYAMRLATAEMTPFLRLDLTENFVDVINADGTAYGVGGGLRLRDAELGVNGSMEGSYLLRHDEYSEYSIGGTLTYGVSIPSDGARLGLLKPFVGTHYDQSGVQRVRGGLAFKRKGVDTSLALEHAMSHDDEADFVDISQVNLNIAVTF